jgi:hypothetical protein
MKPSIKHVFEQTGVTKNAAEHNIFHKIEDAIADFKQQSAASSSPSPTPGLVQLDIADDENKNNTSLTSSGNRNLNDIMDLGERSDATFKRAPLVPLGVDHYAKWDF